MCVRSVLAVIAAIVLWCSAHSTSHAQGHRWGPGHFEGLTVLDQDGRRLSFYDDVIKDRVVVLSFIYTSCTDICPLTTAKLAEVAEKLGDKVGKSIFFLSLSVDPETDTPARLKAFASAFHVPKGWLFLTGTLSDMRRINGSFGERMRSLTEHRNEIVIGNEATGEWMRNSPFGDMDRVVMDILSMDPIWRSVERVPSAHYAHAGHAGHAGHGAPAASGGAVKSSSGDTDQGPGSALYKKLCSACHTVAAGDRVGPDLYGVTTKRTSVWLTKFLMTPDLVRASNDPAARSLVASFPAVRMPNFQLTQNDAQDLIQYLSTRTLKLDQARKAAEAAMSTSAAGHDHHGHNAHQTQHEH